jgi:hypothetical protein
MSDITHSRRATEHLEYYDTNQTVPLPGDDLIKAGVHAGLASARALRELDDTTRRVNRLTADSIDELSGDLRDLMRRRPLLVKLADVWVNPNQVISVSPRGTDTAVSLAGGIVMLVPSDVDVVAESLSRAVA